MSIQPLTQPTLRTPPSYETKRQTHPSFHYSRIILHQDPRPHRKLDVRQRVLLGRGLDRTEINDHSSSRQVLLIDLRSAFSGLEILPFHTIATVHGPALGGGLEVALSCDLRVAGQSPSSIMTVVIALTLNPGLTETKLGIRSRWNSTPLSSHRSIKS